MSVSFETPPDERLFSTRQLIDALKAHLADPSFAASTQKGHEVLCYFLNRAIQIGEACLLVSEFHCPCWYWSGCLVSFFRMYGASMPGENAEDYRKGAISEATKMVQKNLQTKHIKAGRKSSNEDVTTEFLPTLAAHLVKTKRIDKLASELGLSAVYDLLYRYGS